MIANMAIGPLPAIYDFELFPYALGDVLTWNIRMAMRATEVKKSGYATYVCVDPQESAFPGQEDLVTVDNALLLFSELFGAFTTSPDSRSMHLYTDRSEMLTQLYANFMDDPTSAEVIHGYESALKARLHEDIRESSFTDQIQSHKKINSFFAEYGYVPLLKSSWGCEPDVNNLLENVLTNKRIVVIHPRSRRLDRGMGGESTRSRDSDFLEWFEFLSIAQRVHPEVQFIVVGRVQEKPLEILRLSNVMSLRTLGLGLGHELTLILKADLFIGTSSGFAAMANFSKTPYFITKVNDRVCENYGIPRGALRLPFAAPNQFLIHEQETTKMLLEILEQGLDASKKETRSNKLGTINTSTYHAGATTHRYYFDDEYADEETAYLIESHLVAVDKYIRAGDDQSAMEIVKRVERCFPRLSKDMPELNAAREGKPFRGSHQRKSFKDSPKSLRQRGRRVAVEILYKLRLIGLARKFLRSA